ncbi:MAG: translocation/assembly module TamB domain-containing protein [Vicinamibacterales bacterium]
MTVVKRITRALIVVLTLVIGTTTAAVVVFQTVWFKDWLRGYIVREAGTYLNGTLSIERLSGNLFFGVEVENVSLSMDGKPVMAVRNLGLVYNVFEFVTTGLSVDSIRIDRPVVYLRREGDSWSLSRLVKKQATEADRSGPDRPIAVDSIVITDASVIVASPVGVSGVDVPKRFDHLDATLAFKYEPVRYSIEIANVSFQASEPALTLDALSGGISVKDDTLFVDQLTLRTSETSLLLDGAIQNYLTRPVLNLQITSDKLSVPEVARLTPALAGIHLHPSFSLKAAGPLDHLGIDMDVQSSAGAVSGKLIVDALAPGQAAQGALSVKHLDLSRLLNDSTEKSDLTVDAQVDLHGETLSNLNALQGTISLDSPRLAAAGYVAERFHANARINGGAVTLVDGRATAYGTAVTVAGSATLPDFQSTSRAVSFALHGTAAHLDLRQLPRQLNAPAASSDITAEYRVTGSAGPRLGPTNADLTFQPSTVAGARIAAGSTAGVTLNGSDIAYRADATFAGLDLQQVGEQFHVPALAVDRYRSSINGQITATGRGTAPATLELTAHGTLNEASILGGTIEQLTFDVGVADDTARITADGRFSGFDPAVASGRAELEGIVAGTVNLDASVAHVSSGVTPDGIQADGKLTLQPSKVGGLEIARGSLDGSYHDSIGDIRALDVSGPDINVQAHGLLALNENAQSNLEVRADSPSLETMGALLDQPIAGIATISATVTGNRRELKATGNLVGGALKYGDNGALNLSSTFTATVPQLMLADASVVADTHATFVTIAQQDINELDATTTYGQRQLDFEATATQPQRSLAVAGSLLLHPDHQEVHLQRLGLTTEGQEWQLAQASQPTISYAQEAVSVSEVSLVSGEQHISADGTFGRTGDALDVTLTNVDLANVDAILLRPPQLTGMLNGSANISGTTAAPSVTGDFRVDKGGFRQYQYDSLVGRVSYSGAGLTLDAKLEQNPTTYLTARGYVPTALFRGGGTEIERSIAHGAPVAPADRIDLHIESTPIDLGLVQGFTTALTAVSGTVQATIDVTGSAADPHPTGVVTLEKAAFTVEATGVAYSNLQGRIELQQDKVHINNITVLDNHQSALSIIGDLAIHERELGGVEVFVTSNDFHVIDNKLGSVRVNANLEIRGELRAPHIAGDFGVSTGNVNLDEILAVTSDSPYATSQTEDLASSADATPASTPTSLDTLTMDVRLTVPDDLIVKASQLRAPGAPVSLGALNLTLGGDLRATKSLGRPIALIGSVNTIRGTYDFQGRRFEILRDGTVRFAGDAVDDLNPILDLRTRRLIQGVEARVNVRGTLRHPDIVLDSTPPLDQADILSLIVFNQPINSLGAGQQVSLAQRAQEMATSALAGELASSVGSALGLDTLEINTAPDNGAAASLTLGQQLGQNLYMKLEQGIGGASQTNFILEYELTNWLRFRTNVQQGSSTQQQLFQRSQGSGVDLLFIFSY